MILDPREPRASERRGARTLALTALLGLLAPSAALAQSEPAPSEATREAPSEAATREARARFQLAHLHYEAGRFGEAAAELERAYALDPRVALLYDLHLAYRDNGDLEHAADALRRFLEGSPTLEAPTRLNLERRLEALDRAVSQRTTATHETTAASAPEPLLDPTRTAAPTLAPEPTAEPTLPEPTLPGPTLPDPTVAAEPASAPPVHPASPSEGVIGGALTLGAGGLLVVVGGLLGGLALADASALASACPGTSCPSQYRDTAERGRSLAIASDVLWITGVVAAGTGLAVLLVSLAAHDEDAHVHVVPWLAPELAGLSIGGRL